MRDNSVLGSCDQAVRHAGGLVLELRVALIGKEREEGSEPVGFCLYNVNIQYQETAYMTYTAEDESLQKKKNKRALLFLCFPISFRFTNIHINDTH